MKTIRFYLHHGAFTLLAAFLALGCLAVVAGGLSAAEKRAPAAAQTDKAPGRLIIVRSAVLGGTIVGLKVDGVEAARITYNRRYDAPLAAGPHVLTVYPVVSLEGAKPTERRLNVESGKTYSFTAVRDDIQLILK